MKRGGVRRDDPYTSFDAAERVDVTTWKRHAVDAAVNAGDDGVTTREAEAWMRIKMPGLDARWSLSPRWVSLIKDGFIFRTGGTRDGQLINYATSVFPEWMIPSVERSLGHKKKTGMPVASPSRLTQQFGNHTNGANSNDHT